MKRIFVPTDSGTDWQSLLAHPQRHWKLGAVELTTGVYKAACFESPSLYLAWCPGDPAFLKVRLPSAACLPG